MIFFRKIVLRLDKRLKNDKISNPTEKVFAKTCIFTFLMDNTESMPSMFWNRLEVQLKVWSPDENLKAITDTNNNEIVTKSLTH